MPVKYSKKTGWVVAILIVLVSLFIQPEQSDTGFWMIMFVGYGALLLSPIFIDGPPADEDSMVIQLIHLMGQALIPLIAATLCVCAGVAVRLLIFYVD